MRQDYFPAEFGERLRKRLRGFSRLKEKHQNAMAAVIWNLQRYRRHNQVENAVSIPHDDLARRFGRAGFAEANGLVKALRVVSERHKKGSTRAYRLTEKVAKVKEEFLNSATHGLLQSTDGRVIRKLWANAIAPKDINNSTIKAWAGIELPSAVPVNIGEVMQLCRALEKQLKGKGVSGQGELLQTREINRQDCLNAARMILYLASNPAWKGKVPHRYVEHEAGRLYATSFNLQTVPKEVRAAAFDGFWDYDIDNCHFTLLAQLAHKHELSCPAIDEYVRNKQRIRAELAKAVGIDNATVKQCLLSKIYGAQESFFGSIPLAIGNHLAQKRVNRDQSWNDNQKRQQGMVVTEKLGQHSTWQALDHDIETVRRQILAAQRPTNSRKGLRVLNAVGRGIAANEEPKKVLSHLLMGAEAEILRAVVRLHGDSVILPLHDGWVSTKQLDCASLQTQIKEATDWTVTLEENRLQAHENIG